MEEPIYSSKIYGKVWCNHLHKVVLHDIMQYLHLFKCLWKSSCKQLKYIFFYWKCYSEKVRHPWLKLDVGPIECQPYLFTRFINTPPFSYLPLLIHLDHLCLRAAPFRPHPTPRPSLDDCDNPPRKMPYYRLS
jgi:hypothetical protein